MYVSNALFLHIDDLFLPGRGSFRPLSAAGRAGGGRLHTWRKLGTGRAPWRALSAFEVARSGKKSRDRFPPSQSLAGQWKIHTKKMEQQQVFAYFLLCITARTSPGRLATSHIGPPRVQQQSRSEPVCLCHGALVCVRVCQCVFEDDGWENLTISGAIVFACGVLLWTHLLKVDLLI